MIRFYGLRHHQVHIALVADHAFFNSASLCRISLRKSDPPKPSSPRVSNPKAVVCGILTQTLTVPIPLPPVQFTKRLKRLSYVVTAPSKSCGTDDDKNAIDFFEAVLSLWLKSNWRTKRHSLGGGKLCIDPLREMLHNPNFNIIWRIMRILGI